MTAADDLAEFWVHTLLVETYLGIKGTGEPIFNPAEPVDGFLEEKRRLVRATASEQVVSSSTFYTDRGQALLFRNGSRVTLLDGVTTTVISCAVNDSGALDLPDHVAVYLA